MWDSVGKIDKKTQAQNVITKQKSACPIAMGDRKLSDLEIVRIGICQNWKLLELEIARIGNCQNW